MVRKQASNAEALVGLGNTVIDAFRTMAFLKVVTAGIIGAGIGVAIDKATTPTATDKKNTQLMMESATYGDAVDKLQSRLDNQYAEYQYELKNKFGGKPTRSMRI